MNKLMTSMKKHAFLTLLGILILAYAFMQFSHRKGSSVEGIGNNGVFKHFEDDIGRYLNHHCNPNSNIVVIPDVEPSLVVSNKPIFEGEEITFDYETTESEMAEPFKCACHGNWIRGKNYRFQE